ncbi:MAG TPA: C2 family cysteine protease [Myxococcota bacterium]|nr:C2 family cysteine protease [Myxococcota bacterium]
MGPDGPKPEHVKQGIFGDCFLLAGVMGLARRRPEAITSGVFQTNPQEPQTTHKVRFFRVPRRADADQSITPETVSVSNSVLSMTRDLKMDDGGVAETGTAYGAHGEEPWPAIIEKAFAAWPGRPSGEDLAGGHGNAGLAMLTGDAYVDKTLALETGAEAHDAIRGKVPTGLSQIETMEAEKKLLAEARARLVAARRPAHKQKLIELASSGEPTSVSTKGAPSDEWRARCAPTRMPWSSDASAAEVGSSGEAMMGGIAHKHVYELVDATDTSVKLRNPWGKYARVRGSVKKDQAVSELTWTEFFEVATSYTLKT